MLDREERRGGEKNKNKISQMEIETLTKEGEKQTMGRKGASRSDPKLTPSRRRKGIRRNPSLKREREEKRKKS